MTTTRFRNSGHNEDDELDSRVRSSYRKENRRGRSYWTDLINPVKQSYRRRTSGFSAALIVNLSAILLCLIFAGAWITDFKFNDGRLFAQIRNDFVSTVNTVSNRVKEKDFNGVDPLGSDVSKRNIGALSVEADFTPDSGNELATFVAREGTSQRGRIDVYNNAGGIVGTIDIDDVVNMYCADVTVPDFSSPKRNLLIVETEYDESVGAYTKTRVSTVYLYDGNNFISVWSGPVEVESSWNLKWNKDGRSSKASMEEDWAKLSEENSISFSYQTGGDKSAIPVMKVNSHQEYQRYDPECEDYVVEKFRDVQKLYVWDEELNLFICSRNFILKDGAVASEFPSMAEKSFNVSKGTEVIVLEAERNCSEALLWDGPFMLKVQLPNGKRCFIMEDFVVTSTSSIRVSEGDQMV